MRRLGRFGWVCVLVGFASTTALAAAPLMDDVVFNMRLWNDDPDSTVANGDLYPNHVWIQDTVLDGDGRQSSCASCAVDKKRK